MERGDSLTRELQSAMVMPQEIGDRYIADNRAMDLIRRIHARAEGPNDTSERRVARRTLGGVFVGLLERSRGDLDRKKYSEAVRYLTFAAEMRPDWPAGWLELARALALGGDAKKSAAALKKAMKAGFKDTARLEKDPTFAKVLPLLDGGL
jgi:predicted Zn-dependent protease